MKQKILHLIFMLIIFSLNFKPAHGQDNLSFITVKPGFIFFTGDLEDENPSGFYSELVYGYYVHPNIVLEGSVGYFHDGVSLANEIFGFPATVTVKGVLHMDKFEPFIGGGCGIYFTRDKGWIHGSYVDDKDNVFGSHLLTGIDYRISSRINAGIEGKYIFTEKAEYSGVRVNLNAVVTIVRLGIRF